MKIHINVEFDLWGKTEVERQKLVWNKNVKEQAKELYKSLEPVMEIEPWPNEGLPGIDTHVEYEEFLQQRLAPAVLKLIAENIDYNDEVLNPRKENITEKFKPKNEDHALSKFIAKFSETKYQLRWPESADPCRIVDNMHVCGATLFNWSREFFWLATANDDSFQYYLNCNVTFTRVEKKNEKAR